MELMLAGPEGQVQSTADRNGAQLVTRSGTAFAAAVERGEVYFACSQATVASQGGLSVTAPGLVIANRNNSGKNVKLWYVGHASLVSPGAAAQTWGCLGIPNATAVVETTAAVTRNAKTGAGGAPSGIWVGIDGDLPAVPVAVMQLGSQLDDVITTSIRGFDYSQWLDGAFWIPEGFNFSIQSSTASTYFANYIFEVVDA